MKANEIYEKIDKAVPFSYQEKWDNSGLLISNDSREIKKAVITLDISCEAALFAAEAGAELIVSHHPVIFDALKKIDNRSPVYKLIKNDISAICIHTPLDTAPEGMNCVLYNLFKEPLELKESYVIAEPTINDNIGFGFIAELEKCMNTSLIAQKIKKILGVLDVRYSDSEKEIKKIAVCSGSGGSMMETAKESGADILITGDIKHDRWVASSEIGISLLDCGHYFTENICLDYLEKLIKDADSSIEVERFEKAPYEVLI